MITKEQVEHIASLAKLKFSDEEIDKFTNKFSDIVKYIEKLDEVNTAEVEPTYQVYEYNQRFREDIVKEGLTREEVLQNTLEKQYGYFKLFNILD
ncbi:Asp-tRNA(Asn)/Glu-tRNA(Gln) amidotransferase subunit GatC [Tissierella sp.]|uniref:Asp-tRNA(Asn)/Glu-tRNA(Gln) amidotransferase subunit GatC n=1 Tax=Tissierella sp. TaxID=41274 RepID=UPI00285E11C9|nr:Asp-tRNA(Asn)/Glu-tRNA(Gln) amidotransferase subunit GatC [Tissierella sp.]MDR7856694.1 Asp-tRNA(Asn)/Glu-tRNA(Gln) amidotransferase subunit GatC [Tissierella sp.]